nr:polyphosphate kinase 2 family protein [Propionibacterium sp.]
MGNNRTKHAESPLSELLRAPRGSVDLRAIDTNDAPGYPGDGKEDADEQRESLEPELDDLQERLYAQGKVNPETAPRLLLILQGLDTSGKGGAIRHAVGMVDPQGIKLTAFKAPTEEERAHHFLWRIERALPGVGMIGVFDRSHYEDVLIGRVENLAPPDVIERRYDEINAFEAGLVEQGYVLVKCLLHISADEQKARLQERLDKPDKHWKYNPGDLGTRAKWDAYLDAFNVALERCNPDSAPWYVIPADKKWYRDWAVTELLREKLAALRLEWPKAEFDVEEEKRRLAET